ncbi:MAG: MBL fold metallo-hydrolase [Candidatus Riflebacteria bacterium]|nr:MBL fold metallo-hydrolase [Candidatus Riflebacteria bacterium]
MIENLPNSIDLHFLGGASAIGASSSLLRLGDSKILVDCGIRMGETETGTLPDLSPLNDFIPQALVLTHAHMDHSGALPLVLASLPRVPMYCTPPTAQLIRILFEDALKIMNSKGAEDVPLYSKTMVEEALNRIVEVPFDHSIAICEGKVLLKFFPAGHILGAAMAEFQSTFGKVLFTGDFMVEAQRTVGGAAIPKGRYDLVVSESTYGSRFHPNRENEERRLAEIVSRTITNGGFVLIPAFAIGRSQEVILILSREMEQGHIPTFPVYVDGMVTKVCNVYRDFPNDLTNALAKRIKKLSHPFFPEDGPVKAVLSPKNREEILKGPPCVIISSSGMLTGGPSVYYAAELAIKPGNLIAFTGYQDEESPGRKLIELAECPLEERTLQVDRRRISIKCSLEKFNLSAHADGRQIVRLISLLKPQNVALVHGDDQTREELWGLLRSSVPDTKIHLPSNGDLLSIKTRKRKTSTSEKSLDNASECLGAGRFPETIEDIEIIHVHVLLNFPPGRFFTARELYNLFTGPNRFDAENFEKFRGLVKSAKNFFRAHKERPFLFKPLLDQKDQEPKPEETKPAYMEQNAAIATARRMFEEKERLFKIGVRLDISPPVLLLSFAFPDSIKKRLSEKFSRLAEVSGYAIEINPETRQEEVVKLLGSLIPKEIKLLRSPAFHREKRKITVKAESQANAEIIRKLSGPFEEETGFSLEVTVPAKQTSLTSLRDHQTGRMEINAALSHISQAFLEYPQTLFKTSKKFDGTGEFIELAFLTPFLGQQFKKLLDSLESDVGWEIRISQSVQQQALMQKAIELISPFTEIIGNPSFHANSKEIEVKVGNFVDADSFKKIADEFSSKTGFNLKFKIKKG